MPQSRSFFCSETRTQKSASFDLTSSNSTRPFETYTNRADSVCAPLCTLYIGWLQQAWRLNIILPYSHFFSNDFRWRISFFPYKLSLKIVFGTKNFWFVRNSLVKHHCKKRKNRRDVHYGAYGAFTYPQSCRVVRY